VAKKKKRKNLLGRLTPFMKKVVQDRIQAAFTSGLAEGIASEATRQHRQEIDRCRALIIEQCELTLAAIDDRTRLPWRDPEDERG
jgi:hypothetical protein